MYHCRTGIYVVRTHVRLHCLLLGLPFRLGGGGGGHLRLNGYPMPNDHTKSRGGQLNSGVRSTSKINCIIYVVIYSIL